ncbi:MULTISPECIES: hypothetical protein [unclassified Mesorhizobium]|uniref:hypothetical protein n=1 Tax=unclassified Mesorhizobium TaxID=325217 RepID=UPI003337A6D6
MTDQPLYPATSGGTVVPLRNTAGQFVPGNPGNGGRKSGSRNRVSSEFAAAIKDMSDEAIRSLRALLAKNDLTATLWVAERIIGKGRLIEIEATPNDVRTALADGTITTTEARDIATTLSRLADVESVEAMRQELAELRQLIERNNGQARY